MHVPPWLTIGIAVLVIAFGLYRIRLALKPADPAPEKKSGFYRMAGRTHLLVGVVYLLLGGALIATTFGWNPLQPSVSETHDTKPAPKGAVMIAPGSATGSAQ